MMLNNVTQILVPDTDSQFRLRPCARCQEDNVAYVQYVSGGKEPWRVECFGCGHAVDKGLLIRHEAQLAWNREGMA